MVEFRRYRHGSPEPPHQGPDVGKPNSLAGLVLGAGAAKQVEDALMVLGIDTTAVVGNLENRKAELGPASDRDIAGNSRLEVFQRIVDQIGENLFHREAVADDVGQRFDADGGLGLGGLVRHGGPMVSISSRVSIGTGWNSRRPSRVRLRIAVIRRSILAIDDLMKPNASVKSCESCLSAPSSTGSAVSVALSGTEGAEVRRWRGCRSA